MTEQPRRPIHADDPPEVFEAEAQLLAAYSNAIGQAVDEIIAEFPEPEYAAVAAKAYIDKIGENIPDQTIKAAVKKLATIKFKLRGIG